jgi:F-type H+-transporting ATPase subunit epsilon
MTAAVLHLELITPDGHLLEEDAVDEVVFRRREARFELGSEVAVLPGHAPMLVRIPDAPLRYRTQGRTVHLQVGGGFVEVKRGRVLVVTPRFEPAGRAT